MAMKPLIILLLAIISFCACGQDKIDNYSFFKLYVTNDKDEVLLVKWEGQWEIIGERYNEPFTAQEFIRKMATSMGIKIDEPKLCGLYTQKWRGNNGAATIMHYYKAKYAGGDLKIPDDCTEIKWFSFDEAINTIPYEVMTSMMKEIKKNPGKVIGAAFERYKDAKNVTQYKTLENYYIMN